MARTGCAWVAMALAIAGGCAREQSDPYALRASVGTYDDGSGRVGLAALGAIRGEQGQAPDVAWSLALARGGDRLAGDAAYPAQAAHAIALWPEVAPAPATTYDVIASDGERTLSASASLGEGGPLAVPAPALALEGARLEWPAVAGAAAYACTVTAGTQIHAEQTSPTAGCDLAALPPGGYRASVQALSADPAAIPAGAAPTLPARFDVSHARVGVLLRSAGPSLALRAAGGRIDYGLVPGLAIWVSLARADGSADGGTWSIEVTGPNLPASDPLRFDLPANFTRRLVWAYALPADPGLYSVTARSGDEEVATAFAIGAPAPLPLPDGVSVQPRAGGSARVAWNAVPGARSYLAAAWIGATYRAGQWVAGNEALFPDGTFTPGTTYDVYVTASDVDMAGGVAPTRVSASENSYTPASFTAP